MCQERFKKYLIDDSVRIGRWYILRYKRFFSWAVNAVSEESGGLDELG